MKRPFLLFAFAGILGAWTVRADDIALIDGRVYREAVVFSQTPTTVTIRHADGLVSVGKELLPPELRGRYPIDEAGIREAERRAELARKAAREQAAIDAERIERLRKQREGAAQESREREAHALAVEDAEYATVERAAKERAEVYFKHEYNPGNGSAVSWDTEISISEVRPVEGWPGRWLVRGRAFMKFYQSQGRTMMSQTRDFEAYYSKDGRKTGFEISVR